MVKPVLVYPDRAISYASAEVRRFDEHLETLIADMKDTMDAVGAEGLAAIQIGVSEAVVLVKNDAGELLELINPRIIRKSGTQRVDECTLYLPGIERTINRYDAISLVYQDRHGTQHSLKTDGRFSALLQRKIDYTFGSSFVGKMNQLERDDVERELRGKAAVGTQATFDDYAPISGREYFKSVITKLLFIQFLTLFSPLFGFSPGTMDDIYVFNLWVGGIVLALIAGYYIYARYEASRVISCTGCQVVSFLAVSLKFLGVALILSAANYFLIHPA